MSTFSTFRTDVNIYINVIYVNIYNMYLEMSTSHYKFYYVDI